MKLHKYEMRQQQIADEKLREELANPTKPIVPTIVPPPADGKGNRRVFKPSVTIRSTSHQKMQQYTIDKESKMLRTELLSHLLQDIKVNKQMKEGGLSVKDLCKLTNQLLPVGFKPFGIESVYKWAQEGLDEPPAHGGTRIPEELFESLSTYMECQQKAGTPVQPSDIKEVIGAVCEKLGFDTHYIYRQLRKKHPENMDYVVGDDSDLRRADWLTYSNAKKWSTGWCEYLVKYGFAKFEDWVDADGLEYTIRIHEYAKDRIMNADETAIELSNKAEKGGSREYVLGSRAGNRPKKKVVEASGHTTLMAGATLKGSMLPQHYIFSTDAEETSSIDLLGIEGLPVISNAKGDEIPTLYSSTPKGSMDVKRFGDYCDSVMKFFGDTLSPNWEFDPDTGELLKGPIVLQVDSGPGRFADSDENFEIRERTARLGMGIYAGLPNGTAALQMMDAVFNFFQAVNAHELAASSTRANTKARRGSRGGR